MTKAARGGTVSNNSEAEGRVIATSSVVFSDGSLIELVASANDGKPALLFFNGKRVRIAPQIHHLGQLYQPLKLDRSLRQAIRLPSAARTYGSTKALFGGIANLFERYVALSAPEAAMVTAWTATSWFPDCLWSPPTLVVSGPDMSHAITFFRLLGCVCRRGLLLAEFSRNSFRYLPMALRPTLLVSQPYLARTMTSLLRASNYRGLFVPGNRGTVLDIACSKAVYWGMEGGADLLDDTALHLALPPARHSELKDFRVLLIDSDPVLPTDKDVRAGIEKLAANLGKAGIAVTRQSPLLPDFAASSRLYMRMLLSLLGANFLPEVYAGAQAAAAQLAADDLSLPAERLRSEEHTSELQSL
jgi:hypothetical protein